MAVVDEISPSYMGSNFITLQLDSSQTAPMALDSVTLDVDYSRTDAYGGTVAPLELVIRPPTDSNLIRKVFNDTLPKTISFTPQEGGPHLVVLREVAHNRFVGILSFNVEGEPLEI